MLLLLQPPLRRTQLCGLQLSTGVKHGGDAAQPWVLDDIRTCIIRAHECDGNAVISQPQHMRGRCIACPVSRRDQYIGGAAGRNNVTTAACCDE